MKAHVISVCVYHEITKILSFHTTVFLPNPILLGKHTASHFKWTSFHCNVSECKSNQSYGSHWFLWRLMLNWSFHVLHLQNSILNSPEGNTVIIGERGGDCPLVSVITLHVLYVLPWNIKMQTCEILIKCVMSCDGLRCEMDLSHCSIYRLEITGEALSNLASCEDMNSQN